MEDFWWRFIKSGIHSAARTISAVSNFSLVGIINSRGKDLDSLLEITPPRYGCSL
jgi:hypothetical protein